MHKDRPPKRRSGLVLRLLDFLLNNWRSSLDLLLDMHIKDNLTGRSPRTSARTAIPFPSGTVETPRSHSNHG